MFCENCEYKSTETAGRFCSECGQTRKGAQQAPVPEATDSVEYDLLAQTTPACSNPVLEVLFCSGCGCNLKDTKDNFCTECGRYISTVPVTPTFKPSVTHITYATPIPADKAGGWIKGIAALFVIISVVSMIYGWVSWSIIPYQIEYGAPSVRWPHFLEIIWVSWSASFFALGVEYLTAFSIITIIAWVGTSVSILGYAVFSILMHVGSKKACIFGILSSIISILMSWMYIIFLRFVTGGDAPDRVSYNIVIVVFDTYPSIWVYLTLVLGLGGLIFMIVFRNKLNSK